MAGAGNVRDLREAAALSPELASLLQGFSAAQTRAEQMALIDPILNAWANTAPNASFMDRLDGTLLKREVINQNGEVELQNVAKLKFAISLNAAPVGKSVTQSTADDMLCLNGSKIDAALLEEADGLAVGAYPVSAELEILAKLRILEAFSGDSFFSLQQVIPVADAHGSYDTLRLSAGSINQSFNVSLGAGSTSADVQTLVITEKQLGLTSGQSTPLNSSYDALKNSVYQALAWQTRATSYLSKLEIGSDTSGQPIINTTALQTYIEQKWLDNPIQTAIDIAEIISLKAEMFTLPELGNVAQLLLGKLDSLNQSQSEAIRSAGLSILLQRGRFFTGNFWQ